VYQISKYFYLLYKVAFEILSSIEWFISNPLQKVFVSFIYASVHTLVLISWKIIPHSFYDSVLNLYLIKKTMSASS